MEVVLALLGLVAAAYFLVAPTIAMVLAGAASRRARELETRLYRTERELANLRSWAGSWAAHQHAVLTEQAQAQARAAASNPAQIVPSGTAPVGARLAGAAPAGAELAVTPAATPQVSLEAAARSGDGAAGAIEPAAHSPEAPLAAPARIDARPDFADAPPHELVAHIALARDEAREEARDAMRNAARDAARDEARGSVPADSPASLEERLGLNWLTRVGAAAFVLGALFFFKYAVDSAWIGPTGRVAVGGAVGALLILTAELIRAKTRPGFVQALMGIGLALLFASVWASAVSYDLIPIPAAFGANTLILFIGAALSFRHRGEAILVLSLVAGLLNPVVLSTGSDRPLELFVYLLLITTVAHAVAIKLRFRVVPWLAVAGVAALFGGWHTKYFDIAGTRADLFTDLPGNVGRGAYADLGSRVVPLLAVLAFAAQWIGAALWQRRRSSSPEEASAPSPSARRTLLALCGLIGAHAGVAVLLPDSPRVFAVSAAALAVASILTLRALDVASLLIVPMGAAFVALLAICVGVPVEEREILAALFAAWAAIYAAGAFDSLPRAVPEPRRGSVAARSAAAVVLFGILAGVLFAEDRPTVFAAILAAASALIALLAVWSGARWILLLTAAASALAHLVMAPHALELAGPQAHADVAFLVAVAAWGLVHFAAALVPPGMWPTVGVSHAEPPEAQASPADGSPAATAIPAAIPALMPVAMPAPPRPRSAPQEPETLPWSAVFAASIAGLAFLGAVLLSTTPDVPMLRALLTAASGCADLVLGALLLRRDHRSDGRASGSTLGATVLVGQALGLFAAAIAFGMGGATVTILWAVLATVAAAAAARSKQPLWLAITAALFLATLMRLGIVDVYETHAVVARYFATHGRDGVMVVPTLLNPRAYALAGAGVALVISSRLLGRSRPGARVDESLRGASAATAIVGYTLLLALAVTESRAAFTRAPPPPPVLLDAAEWLAFKGHYDGVIEAQAGSVAMTTTLVLGLFAAALLAAGFVAKDTFHRYLGLTLFLITVGKLAAWDVWHIERVYQIVLLTGIGALLVAGGFLYARFGQRIVALMREGAPPGSGAGLLVVLFVLLGARSASAQPVDPTEPRALAPSVAARYTSLRRVTGVSVAGDHRVDVDLDLYRESRSESLLADLRLAGPGGAEVPYELRPVHGSRTVEVIPSQMLDPSHRDDDVVHATFEIGRGGRSFDGQAAAAVPTHCKITLRVQGDTFLRRVRVETGEDRRKLGLVAEGGYVHRIQHRPGSVEHLEVDYPTSRAPLVRVTLIPEGTPSPVRITGGDVHCAPAAPATPPAWLPLRIEDVHHDPDAKQTIVTLDAGAEGVPLEALILDVGTAEFHRRVHVDATSYRAIWPDIGGGVIQRVKPRDGFVLASTRVPLVPTRKRWLRLTIEDHDAAPIELRGVLGEVRPLEIVFRAAVPGEHTLYVGDPLGQPARYDLADTLARSGRDEPPRRATLGPTLPNPLRGGASASAGNLPVSERHRGVIGAALAVVLVGLSIWAALLLRRSAEPS